MNFGTRTLCQLLLIAISSVLSFSQVVFYRPSPFVVKIHHLDDYENTCILVKPDGRYRLERTQNHKQVSLEGSLSSVELQDLHQLLDNVEFQAITRQEINNPLLTSDTELFEILVPRKGRYQELRFIGSDSRKPWRRSLDPALTWFNRIKKDKRSVPSVEPVSGCQPEPVESDTENTTASQAKPTGQAPDETEVKHSATTPSPSDIPGKFIVHLMVDNFSNGTLTSSCVGVFPGGQFQMEKESQRALEDRQNGKIYEGRLSENQMSALRQILDAQDLVAAQHRNIAKGIAMYEGEVVTVRIPRTSYIQQLIYTSYFGASERFSDAQVRGGTFGLDPETRVIKPLREWIKNNVEKKKGEPLKEAAHTNCSGDNNEADKK